MAIIRWLLIGFGALVVLLIALIVGAMLFVDTRQLQDIIAEQVEENTGRELRFEGDLSLSFFPWLGFELGETRLANAAGFEDDGPFAAIGTTELRVRVLPLLRRQVVLDTIVLRNLELNLGVDGNGRSNWADIEERLAGLEDADEPDEEPADEEDRPADLPFDLRVGGFELAAATINWRDRETGTAVTIRDLDLTTGPIALGEDTPVSLNVTLEPEGAPSVTLAATTTARATLSPLRATLREFVLDIDATGEDLPGGAVSARLEADIDADLDGGSARVEPLSLGLADTATGNGSMNMNLGADVPTFDGRLDFPAFSPRELANALDIELPPMADGDALGALAFGFAFHGAPDRVAVDDFALTLDDTRMTGQLTALLQDTPRIDARFDADAIDLDRYLPESDKRELAEVSEAAEEDDDEAGDPIAELPLEAFRAVNANARMGIDRVGYSGLDMTDVVIAIVLEDGLLTLRDSGGSIAGGRIGLDGRFDARGDEPAAAFSANIQRVGAQPLIEAFLASSPLIGQFDSSLSLNMAGGTLDEWLGTLAGEFSARFGEGAIRGFSIDRTLRNAAASLRGQAEQESAEALTPFAALNASGRIRDGVLTTRAFSLESERVRGTGEGDVDIGRGRIDYTATFTVTRALLDDGVDDDQRLEGLTVPIRLTGSLFSPSVDVDLTSALEARARGEVDAAREEVRQEVDRAREEASEEVERERREAEEELRDRVRDLFD